jgi:hypothetical protein
MADTRPTHISPWRAVYLCVLCVTRADLMEEAEREDSKRREAMGPAPPQLHRALMVRRAFWESLAIVLLSLILGYGLGEALSLLFGAPLPTIVSVLQLTGASLLLWGTLFVRGWSIQTFSGVTLTERVNQWLYRALYFVGTAIFTCSLAWL